MTVTIHLGDCREIIATLPDCSVDSIVTDPPYELGFMGKQWDASGIAYNVTLWEECLRVLKPGGHLLAFGGTRTYHRMTVAIEDAGFEIRDSIHWLYGSGFPKSHDVSKAIDKAAGAEREVIGRYESPEGTTGKNSKNDDYGFGLGDMAQRTITAPATDAARQWEGWGTALKPAHEPIVMARKPLVGTVAANVLEHGTGALNIDGTRVATNDKLQTLLGSFSFSGSGGANEKGKKIVKKDAGLGRWPANLVITHAADCGDDCAADCPVAELDQQSGITKDGIAVRRNGNAGKGTFPVKIAEGSSDVGYGGQGGASRFFTVTHWDDITPFFYTNKSSKAERNAGAIIENRHPTVKPLALMRWLVRLATPPGGTVLEPFAGSGTTLAAAILEGFDAIGCELTDDYLPIIEGRIAWAQQQTELDQESLFNQ